ncbi:hypothetical protein [Rhizobium sp.]|jgi:hypothetical protein|uniref:hypothetical protein n=1 Tax=Rhizobium sp. TaxID=391 RepID=UPI000E878C7B|nr:hypothetical protein [Rhizobium sp.]
MGRVELGTCVVVLGMHRSGTSAISGAFVALGAGSPKTFMSADANNEKGYFESLAIMRINDDVLKSAGSFWFD